MRCEARGASHHADSRGLAVGATKREAGVELGRNAINSTSAPPIKSNAVMSNTSGDPAWGGPLQSNATSANAEGKPDNYARAAQ